MVGGGLWGLGALLSSYRSLNEPRVTQQRTSVAQPPRRLRFMMRTDPYDGCSNASSAWVVEDELAGKRGGGPSADACGTEPSDASNTSLSLDSAYQDILQSLDTELLRMCGDPALQGLRESPPQARYLPSDPPAATAG